MALFSSTPEEQVAKAGRKKLEGEKAAADEFAQSPAGRARTAKQAGAKIFQVDFPLSYTSPRFIDLVGSYARSSKTSDKAGTIELIEAEGWRLEHVGYVYRVTGSVSRDKFLSSGQHESTSGDIVGIYLFRLTE